MPATDTESLQSPAERIIALLARAGIATKDGFVGPNGGGVFTFRGRETADRARLILARAFRVGLVCEAWDNAAENVGGVMLPTMVRVYRVRLLGIGGGS